MDTTICGDNRSTVYTDIKAIVFMIVKPVVESKPTSNNPVIKQISL